MPELVKLFTDIALLRKGPQDVPASALLLGATVAAYFAVNFIVSTLLPPIEGPWLAHLLVDIVFALAWYALVLRIVGKSERYLQTATAVFGYQALLAPLWVASGWLVRSHMSNNQSAWQLPVALLALILVVWMISVTAHILKAALEWSMAASVLLVIAQLFAAQAVLFLIFPDSPAP